MRVIRNSDHVILSNNSGSYHMSLEEFEKVGEKEAIKRATDDIRRKTESIFDGVTINFDQARALGFCEYGIRDFCNRLDLNIDVSHSLKDVREKLTIEAFLEYPDECKKLFGKDITNKFGGLKEMLNEHRTENCLYFVLKNYPDQKTVDKLACQFALNVIDNFERIYPQDRRPREAILAKLEYIEGKIDLGTLQKAHLAACSAAHLAACSAAHLAARSAAHLADSAAHSAHSAAYSAACSARSAHLAAYSAACSADSAYSAETKKQIEMTLKALKG